MHRQRQFHTSTSKFRQSFRALIQESLIQEILMPMQQSGRQRQKTSQEDLLRTLLNMKVTKMVRHLYLPDHSYKKTVVK